MGHWLRRLFFEKVVFRQLDRLAEDKGEDAAALKLRLFDYLNHETFGLIDARDIFRTDGEVAYFNDKPIPGETLDRLVTDAQRWENSFLWQVLSRHLRYKAGHLIAFNSKLNRDVLGGKMLLELVATLDDILAIIKRS